MKFFLNTKLLFVLFFLCIESQGFATANDFCTPSIVSSLKSHYKSVKSNVYSESLYEAACDKSEDSGTLGFGLNIPAYGELSFASSDRSLREACHTSNKQFFERYSEQVAFAVLPDQAFETLSRCIGGLFLKASRTGSTLSITAAYASPSDGELATITNFSWAPQEALDCTDDNFRKGVRLIPGGITQLCQRRKNVSIAITMNTSHGQKTVWMKADPIIKEVKYSWDYEIRGGPNSGWTTCKTQDGLVGGPVDCRADQSCERPAPIKGLCLIRYGKGYVEINGERRILKDVWDYQVKGGPTTGYTVCSVNGVDIGTPHHCVNDNSCGNANSIRGWCAARYGM